MKTEQTSPPPMFNVPGAVVLFIGAFVAVHIFRGYFSSTDETIYILGVFSFIPATYHWDAAQLIEPWARWWSPITHGFLHGDWTHLFVNSIWLLAFGSAVARRFGALMFTVFMLAGMAAGAGAHYLAYPTGSSPVIGASGAVSACMGAAIRFAFREDGLPIRSDGSGTALSLMGSLKNRSVMIFILIWLVINFIIGMAGPAFGIASPIAWEAHMGGFFLGWLGFGLFDRKSAQFS